MDKPYSEAETAQAEKLLAAHGDGAERAAADILVDMLARGRTEEAIFWLRVRRYLRLRCQTERHTRRLSDKLMLAIEQAVSQGRFDVARGLVPVVHDNRQHDEAVSERRRRTDVANDD